MHFSYKNTLKLCEVFYNIPDNNERKLSISCFANFLELFQINLIIKIPRHCNTFFEKSQVDFNVKKSFMNANVTINKIFFQFAPSY